MSDSGPDPNAWLVTFGDLITLLLTFFVLLLSMSSMDAARVEQSFSHFSGRPFLLVGGESSFIGPPADEIGSPIKEIQRGMDIAQAMRSIFGVEPQGFERLSETVVDSKGEVRVRAEPRGQSIVFSGSFLFALGSATLKASAAPVLNEVAKILKETDAPITVEGHTDDEEKPFNEMYKDRWGLSAARAVHVLKYLNEKGKIPGTRLAAVGYGDTRPLVEPKDNGTRTIEQIRADNRRVEVIVAQDKP